MFPECPSIGPKLPAVCVCSPSVLIVAVWLCAGSSPTALCRPLPHINCKPGLHVIVSCSAASIANG
nr:MAG TPA: hypothetical protein [Caudoviricetes sp.]